MQQSDDTDPDDPDDPDDADDADAACSIAACSLLIITVSLPYQLHLEFFAY